MTPPLPNARCALNVRVPGRGLLADCCAVRTGLDRATSCCSTQPGCAILPTKGRPQHAQSKKSNCETKKRNVTRYCRWTDQDDSRNNRSIHHDHVCLLSCARRQRHAWWTGCGKRWRRRRRAWMTSAARTPPPAALPPSARPSSRCSVGSAYSALNLSAVFASAPAIARGWQCVQVPSNASLTRLQCCSFKLLIAWEMCAAGNSGPHNCARAASNATLFVSGRLA